MILLEYKGWVLTNDGIVSCACLKGPKYRSIARCFHCDEWMSEEVFKHLSRTWSFVKEPYMPDLSDPARGGYTRHDRV